MTKFATYQRPRTGKADGPFGAVGKVPRWPGDKPAPLALRRKTQEGKPGTTGLPDLAILLKAAIGSGEDK